MVLLDQNRNQTSMPTKLDNLSSTDQPESICSSEDEWLFSCRCESAKAVSTLLSCLRHESAGVTITSSSREESATGRRKSPVIQPVTVFCSPSSLTFHVYGTARQSQASVDIPATFFSEYHVATPHETETTTDEWQAGGAFCVNLTTVLDCLHVLGTLHLERTKLCLSYHQTDEIFKMELLEEGILSTAAIPGMLYPEDNGKSLALAFRSTLIMARIIVKSDYLRDAIQELELVHGATNCTIQLGPQGLQLAATGHIGECLVSLPKDGTSIVLLDATIMQERKYLLHSLQSGMRGLDIANETCISINDNGMIAIQHQVLDTVTQGPPSFVDFIMSCLEDEDEGHSSLGIESQRHSSDPTPSMTMGWEDGNTTDTRVSQQSIIASGNKDNDSDEDLPARPTSAAPLFLTVATQISHRSLRQRRSRSQQVSVDGSHTPSAPYHDDSGDDMDVAALTTPRRRRTIAADDDDASSSPEIVYD